jgi:hypothetical protein
VTGKSANTDARKLRHILSLSGGKDSTALALYMRDRVPEMEYVFCDTEKELKETYEYLDRLEAFLGKRIVRLKHDGMGFDDLLKIRNGYLPSPQVRWCTEYLKIKPYEKYVGDDPVISYVGIRADEPHRKGYISTKPNIQARFPFIEDGLVHADILRILRNSGLGLPEYYKWRSRSGCFFCFFQQRREWIGLLENHPELYEAAKRYERQDSGTGEWYTWVQNESLAELARPERIAQVKADYQRRCEREAAFRTDAALSEVFDSETVSSGAACLVCHL